MIVGLLLLAAQAASVSIPLGTYSFPEIAERLSTPQVRISVDASLRERGALVGIHERTIDQSLRLICHALDLAESSKDDRHIVLVPDPTARKRDLRWRNGLLSVLNAKWSAQQAQLTELTKMDNQALNARLAEIQKKPMITDGWDTLCINFLFQGQPVLRAAPWLEDSAPQMSMELLTDRVEQDTLTAQFPGDLANEVRQLVASVHIQDPTFLKRTFVRSAGQLRVISGLYATGQNGALVELPAPNYWIMLGERPYTSTKRILFSQLATGDEDSNLPAIGQDAKDWFAQSRKDTEEALKAHNMDDPMELNECEGSLSSVVEKWAKASATDVVMEMAPLAEPLDLGSGYIPTMQAYFPSMRVEKSLSQCIDGDDGWGLELADGALIIRNRMAFLDRETDCPIGSIAHYFRTSPQRFASPTIRGFDPKNQSIASLDIGSGLPRIEFVESLIQMRLDPSFSAPYWTDWQGYRGLTDLYLRSFVALLWPGLPPDVVDAMRATEAGTVTIPASSCSYETLQQAYAAIQVLDSETQDHIQRDQDQLANDQLSIQWKRAEGGETLVYMSLDSGMGNAAFHVKL